MAAAFQKILHAVQDQVFTDMVLIRMADRFGKTGPLVHAVPLGGFCIDKMTGLAGWAPMQ
jgi:hypothetical protein